MFRLLWVNNSYCSRYSRCFLSLFFKKAQRGKDNLGDEVMKPYTPTTLDSDVGQFELVIKMYPQGGRMSPHFREMRVGDILSVKGPKILRCGPPPMNKAMAAHLEVLGYTPEMQFQF